jgi:hypothetical protein
MSIRLRWLVQRAASARLSHVEVSSVVGALAALRVDDAAWRAFKAEGPRFETLRPRTAVAYFHAAAHAGQCSPSELLRFERALLPVVPGLEAFDCSRLATACTAARGTAPAMRSAVMARVAAVAPGLNRMDVIAVLHAATLQDWEARGVYDALAARVAALGGAFTTDDVVQLVAHLATSAVSDVAAPVVAALVRTLPRAAIAALTAAQCTGLVVGVAAARLAAADSLEVLEGVADRLLVLRRDLSARELCIALGALGRVGLRTRTDVLRALFETAAPLLGGVRDDKLLIRLLYAARAVPTANDYADAVVALIAPRTAQMDRQTLTLLAKALTQTKTGGAGAAALLQDAKQRSAVVQPGGATIDLLYQFQAAASDRAGSRAAALDAFARLRSAPDLGELPTGRLVAMAHGMGRLRVQGTADYVAVLRHVLDSPARSVSAAQAVHLLAVMGRVGTMQPPWMRRLCGTVAAPGAAAALTAPQRCLAVHALGELRWNDAAAVVALSESLPDALTATDCATMAAGLAALGHVEHPTVAAAVQRIGAEGALETIRSVRVASRLLLAAAQIGAYGPSFVAVAHYVVPLLAAAPWSQVQQLALWLPLVRAALPPNVAAALQRELCANARRRLASMLADAAPARPNTFVIYHTAAYVGLGVPCAEWARLLPRFKTDDVRRHAGDMMPFACVVATQLLREAPRAAAADAPAMWRVGERLLTVLLDKLSTTDCTADDLALVAYRCLRVDTAADELCRDVALAALDKLASRRKQATQLSCIGVRLLSDVVAALGSADAEQAAALQLLTEAAERLRLTLSPFDAAHVERAVSGLPDEATAALRDALGNRGDELAPYHAGMRCGRAACDEVRDAASLFTP